VIIGISDDTAQTVGNVPAYLERFAIPWPVGLNDQGEFMREIRPLGSGNTPENYTVSRSGEVNYLGLDRTPESWQKLEEEVVRLLAEPVPAEPPIQPSEPEPAPAFSLPDLDGATFGLAEFAGKPLVVNFFTAGTCDWTGGVLAKLHKDYAARGLQVVGINLYDDAAAIRSCAERHGAQYPMLKGDEATQKAWIGSNEGWATFFVTADGRMLKRIVNSIDNGIEGPVFQKYAEYLLANS
jgi:peroxiredoxin